MESDKTVTSKAQKTLPWINVAILLLVLPLVATNSCSKPERVGVAKSTSSASDEGAEVALENAADLLNDGDFASSFDMLLVASRLTPSNPKVFDFVARFVEQASSSESEEAQVLAEDLLGRGDSLVYFQRPQNVAAARKRLTDLRQKFLASEPGVETPKPLDSIMQLVSVARDETNSIAVRTRAAQQARSLLEEIELQLAMGERSENEQLSTAIIGEWYAKIDAIEQQCVESLYAKLQPRIIEWQTKAERLCRTVDSASDKDSKRVGKELNRAADEGIGLLQELMPFSKSKIESAVKMSDTVEDHVKELQRQKNWLYNKQSLARIREIESKEKETPQKRIEYLAEISEQQLSPYVLRRHNEVWEKLFEKLPNEDEKVKAVRMRILKTKN